MLNKTKCDYCSKSFDVFKENCPYCGNPNNNKPRGWAYNAMTFLPISKQLGCWLGGWLGLQILGLIMQYILVLIPGLTSLNADGTSSFTTKGYVLFEFLLYALALGAMLAIINKDMLKLSKSFRNKWSIFGILCGGVLLGSSIIYSILVSPITPKVNANQTAVVNLIKASPFVSFVMIVMVGPFVEECTYRLGMYSLLRRKSKVFAIILSSIIFAFIHFDFTALLKIIQIKITLSGSMQDAIDALIVELINIPSYIIAGVALAFTYEYFGFAGSLYAHTVNNFVSWITSVIPTSIVLSQILIR